jgi:hypothetical protein
MVTDAYVDDVVGLLGLLRINHESPLDFNGPEPYDGEYASIAAYLHIDSSDGRDILRGQQILELCVDAAAIFVTLETIHPEWRETGEIEWGLVRELLLSELVQIELDDLEFGSARIRYSFNPRTEEGRKRIFGLAKLISLGLSIVATAMTGGVTMPWLIGSAFTTNLEDLSNVFVPDSFWEPKSVERVHSGKVEVALNVQMGPETVAFEVKGVRADREHFYDLLQGSLTLDGGLELQHRQLTTNVDEVVLKPQKRIKRGEIRRYAVHAGVMIDWLD